LGTGESASVPWGHLAREIFLPLGLASSLHRPRSFLRSPQIADGVFNQTSGRGEGQGREGRIRHPSKGVCAVSFFRVSARHGSTATLAFREQHYACPLRLGVPCGERLEHVNFAGDVEIVDAVPDAGVCHRSGGRRKRTAAHRTAKTSFTPASSLARSSRSKARQGSPKGLATPLTLSALRPARTKFDPFALEASPPASRYIRSRHRRGCFRSCAKSLSLSLPARSSGILRSTHCGRNGPAVCRRNPRSKHACTIASQSLYSLVTSISN
jgi:hypothetical protein